MLWVSRHSPSSNQDHETWNEVPLGSSISFSAQPDSSQACAPPNNTHSGVLDIISTPWLSPSMLGESIDATPGSNKSRVEEFLRSSSSLEPDLSNKHDDGEENTVSDECTTHDEMSKTLA